MKVTVAGDSVAWGQGLLDAHKYGFDKVVALGLQFWHESTDCLESAVRDCGDARVSFADAGFTERNAVFATAPLLWGVKMDFSPQGASAGHPNVAGAEQFAQAIVTSLAVV